MKIAFIGNFEVNYCTEVHHKKAFESLGHEAITFQENRARVQDILAHDFDMLYWTHTHGWFHNNNTRDQVITMLDSLRRKGIPTVGYHLDLWLGLKREKDLKSDPYWNLAHFFTVDKLMSDYLNNNTKTKGYFLPPGVHGEECYLAKPDHRKYPHEIVFTGSTNYHPEWPYRKHLVEWLKSTYGERFGHYGAGGLPNLRGDDLNTLYASAKIVIGDTLCKNFNYPEYLSDRFFEVPGRGGFMIFPYIQGAENHFESNEEIVFYEFGDFSDLKGKIDHYLQDNANREAIRLAGHERTKREHTYKHRIEHIIKTIFP